VEDEAKEKLPLFEYLSETSRRGCFNCPGSILGLDGGEFFFSPLSLSLLCVCAMNKDIPVDLKLCFFCASLTSYLLTRSF
jgi:hypothetical protein